MLKYLELNQQLDDPQRWDTRSNEGLDDGYTNYRYGKNEWDGSDLNIYLNESYYDGLSSSSKAMISPAEYYLGGKIYNRSTYGTTEEIYAWERGTNVFNLDNYCLINFDEDYYNYSQCINDLNRTCTRNPNLSWCNVVRSTKWSGQVSLIYPSDLFMTYANGVDNNCYNNPSNCYSNGSSIKSWMYNSNIDSSYNNATIWTLNPRIDRVNTTFSIGYNASFWGNTDYGYLYVRPVVYLKSSVGISG